MRVLLVTQWFSPEPVKLPADLAETLKSLGHQVEILTAFPNYPEGKLYAGYRQKIVQREVIRGVDVTRVPIFPDHSRSAVKRIVNYLSYSISAALIGIFVTKKPDVIFVYGSPYTTAIAGWVHSKIRGVPYVFNVLDLWPEALEASGLMPSRLAAWLVGAGARLIYRSAAAIVVVSHGFRSHLIELGVQPEKISVVSNWVDTDLYKPVERSEEEREKRGMSGHFNLLFAGNVGPAQGLETVLEAAALLRDRTDIQFLIAGDGVSLAGLKNQAQRLGLENVRFLGRLPESEMPALFAAADVLLVTLKRHPLFDITIPHKIFAYMASGKPILAALSGESADIIEQAGAGRGIPPGDPENLARTVVEMARLNADELAAMGAHGRAAVCERYSRARLTQQTATVLSEVATRRE